jgi:uncharacterized membrane protein YfcA
LPEAVVWLALVFLGIAVGAYGTLIGAGGGFLLAPLLLIVYPEQAPEIVTSISLCAVLFNSASGSLAYARQKRIDYAVAITFAVAEVPGAIAGALTTGLFPRDLFEGLFGLILMSVAVLLLRPPVTPVLTVRPTGLRFRRTHTDAQGETYAYSFNPVNGAIVGLGIGFLSATFGVGGGFIYVPAMVLFMRFPAYIATATSTFALLFASSGAVIVHLLGGHYADVVGETLSLAAGVVIGAQIGAAVSARLVSRQVIVLRLMSGALLVIGVRLMVGALL